MARFRHDKHRLQPGIMSRLMTRTVILKLTTRSHGGQRTCAVQDFLVQGIVLQCVRGDVVHVRVRWARAGKSATIRLLKGRRKTAGS